MKKIIIFTLLLVSLLFAGCSNSSNEGFSSDNSDEKINFYGMIEQFNTQSQEIPSSVLDKVPEDKMGNFVRIEDELYFILKNVSSGELALCDNPEIADSMNCDIGIQMAASVNLTAKVHTQTHLGNKVNFLEVESLKII